MTTTIGIRDLARGSAILKEYDYINIEDKKTHQRKGIFVANQYADEVERYLKKIIAKKNNQKIQKKLNAVMALSGSCTIKAEYLNTTTNAELGAAHAQRYIEKDKANQTNKK